MRDRSKKAEIYRYRPPGTNGTPRLAAPEDTRERYYLLIRLKLATENLQKMSWLNIAVIFCAMAMLFAGSVLLTKPTYSQVEKRDLAELPAFSLPALFSGQLTRDYEVYFADTFPLREWFVSLSAVVDESRGVRADDVRVIHGGGMNEVADSPSAQPTLPPEMQPTSSAPVAPAVNSQDESPIPDDTAASSSAPEKTPEPEGDASTISNGIMVYQGRAMSLFGGLKSNGEWYAQVLNSYQEELPDVQIYNMIIPTSSEFYVPKKYNDLSQSQADMIDYIYSNLDPKIKRVDAVGELGKHTDEYLYFRTDHHWTGLGAYYAYTAFCKQAGFEPMKISDFTTKRLDEFVGTMYGQTQDSSLLENPDYVDYYLFDRAYTAQRFMAGSPNYGIDHQLWGEYAQSPNSYSVFLQGDFPLIKVKTDLTNGRKIMVVKESFGNAFAPFLINHYEEVYVVDQRYFQLAAIDLIKQNGINELIFANNSFAACTPYHIRCIDGIRHQVFTPAPAQPVEPEPEAVIEETEEVSASKPERKPSKKEQSSATEDEEEIPDDRQRLFKDSEE